MDLPIDTRAIEREAERRERERADRARRSNRAYGRLTWEDWDESLLTRQKLVPNLKRRDGG